MNSQRKIPTPSPLNKRGYFFPLETSKVERVENQTNLPLGSLTSTATTPGNRVIKMGRELDTDTWLACGPSCMGPPKVVKNTPVFILAYF